MRKMSNNDNEVPQDPISSRIERELAGISSKTSDKFIFRIDHLLRMTNEAAYEPEMVSIGPYHRGKTNLQKMEKYKLEYLKGILKRQNETSPRKYIDCQENEETSLISLAVSCLNDAIINKSSSSSVPRQCDNPFHLLSLMYESWFSSFAQETTVNIPLIQNGSISNGNTNHPPQWPCTNFRKKNREAGDDDDIMFIKSVTELKQDGIKFVKAKQSTSWLDLSFKDGEIQIPPLVIQGGTESILRNLIVYEQYMFDLECCSGKFVTDYAIFMDCLINTPRDVQKLRVKGIIKNWLGSDEEVTNMFNKICNNVFPSLSSFAYRKEFKNVNEYCNERRNPWISDLKKTYFKNPWSIISLFAATLLLSLTFLQTVLSSKKDCSCK